MLDINGNEIAVGNKVKLVSPDPGYTIGTNNPAVGTKWECAGVYRGNSHVEWENGSSNGYKNGELAPAEPYINIWHKI
jgi:hypothetical protein